MDKFEYKIHKVRDEIPDDVDIELKFNLMDCEKDTKSHWIVDHDKYMKRYNKEFPNFNKLPKRL